MTAHYVVLELTEILFRKIERAAQGLNEPMPQALVKIVENSLPSLDKAPQQYRADLEALEALTNQELWRVSQEVLPPSLQHELSDLLRENERETLNSVGEARLDTLLQESNRLMLRKSYALALLKWRGSKVPTPAGAKSVH